MIEEIEISNIDEMNVFLSASKCKSFGVADFLELIQLANGRNEAIILLSLKDNGQLVSREVEQLKKQIRLDYNEKVENYFHDIIIHIGDNYSHSQQSNKLI